MRFSRSYTVTYVGDDSLTHEKTFRARGHVAAIEAARKEGIEEVLGVRRAHLLTRLFCWGVAIAIVAAALCLHWRG